MIVGKWNYLFFIVIFVVIYIFIFKDKYFFLFCSDVLEREFFLFIFVEVLMIDFLCLYL